MNNEIEKNVKENLVYEVRGKRVMLDSDLAKLYECNNGTKELNQLVRRHIEKFPNDVYFQLTKEEYLDLLRSQIVTLKVPKGHHVKYLPYVFSKEGIEILNSIIRNKNKEKIYEKILNDFQDAKNFNLVEMRANPYKIEDLIYEVRGRQVMLDSDLAKLYQVETKRINEAVKNNLFKFPERFSFKLTSKEYFNLRSKFSTSSLENKNFGGRRYDVRVFTEQGVAMLATILKSDIAAKVSIAIMDAFVLMRKYISKNLFQQNVINKMVLKHDDDIKQLQESFNKFEEKANRVNEIYFNGQIYDAYSKILEIFKSAKKELIIIDNYADSTILDIIRRLAVKVKLITKKNNLLTEQDIEKYNKQYHNLKVYYDNTYHDRYFIIDKEEVYHCGASINMIGYKTFSINYIGDGEIKKLLISKIVKCFS